MDRLVLVVGAVLIAGAVSWLLGRRSGAAPASNTGHVPNALDRLDFTRPDAPWLVAVFSSTTCDTCAGVWDGAAPLESDDVAVQRIDYQTDEALHRRYRIDAVPTLVVTDASGVVRTAVLGPVSREDLWATVAAARDPGGAEPGTSVDFGD